MCIYIYNYIYICIVFRRHFGSSHFGSSHSGSRSDFGSSHFWLVVTWHPAAGLARRFLLFGLCPRSSPNIVTTFLNIRLRNEVFLALAGSLFILLRGAVLRSHLNTDATHRVSPSPPSTLSFSRSPPSPHALWPLRSQISQRLRQRWISC